MAGRCFQVDHHLPRRVEAVALDGAELVATRAVEDAQHAARLEDSDMPPSTPPERATAPVLACRYTWNFAFSASTVRTGKVSGDAKLPESVS